MGGVHRCFHAFRHTFKTACRAARIEEELHDAITGHSGGGVGRSYGSFPLEALNADIQLIDYKGLVCDWTWKAPESISPAQSKITQTYNDRRIGQTIVSPPALPSSLPTSYSFRRMIRNISVM